LTGKRWKLVFEKQYLHYSFLIVFTIVVLLIARLKPLLIGEFIGLSAFIWLCLGIASAALHQIFVWFCWRTQLHISLLTRIFDRHAFFYYGAGFVLLAVFRYFTIVALAIANKNSLPVSNSVLNSLAIVAAIPVVYLFYSVIKYFGFERALGADHFYESYQNKPLVTQGIFRYSRNAMYTFGFLLAWIPGFLTASSAALLLAMFNNLYIWVHYYATEKPDMVRIYGATIDKGRR
jgi:protein-S-isoprenylcysteine O-methyltransferase Ste14